MVDRAEHRKYIKRLDKGVRRVVESDCQDKTVGDLALCKIYTKML